MSKFTVIEGERIEVREPDAERPPEFSDEALALAFATAHADDLRYVAKLNKWMIWDGKVWWPDDTLRAFDLARAACRAAAARAPDKRVAASIASAKTSAAVERLAKADRRLAATTDQWDADPWLLNTPAGIIDLRSGQTAPHSAAMYMTKITAVAPGGECSTWFAFLDRVTGGDVELQNFFQRFVGYALTGSTREHALAFHHGTGANGKSVFTGAVAGMLGGYHTNAPIETFTASNLDRHPTELAGLRGARLVTAVETEEGRRWAEARIKALTGGDPITARFMRQDFFTFTPVFKLMIAGNHKPGLRSVDEAIRRRFLLVPFNVTIPAAERDLTLFDKLKEEWGGILAWAIEGCLEWQRQGLAPPATVLHATAKYLEAEDAIAAWIEDRCDIDSEGFATYGELFGSFKAWAERTGEDAGTQKRFIQSLEDRGFHLHRTSSARGFRGIRVRPPSPDDPWSNR